MGKNATLTKYKIAGIDIKIDNKGNITDYNNNNLTASSIVIPNQDNIIGIDCQVQITKNIKSITIGTNIKWFNWYSLRLDTNNMNTITIHCYSSVLEVIDNLMYNIRNIMYYRPEENISNKFKIILYNIQDTKVLQLIMLKYPRLNIELYSNSLNRLKDINSLFDIKHTISITSDNSEHIKRWIQVSLEKSEMVIDTLKQSYKLNNGFISSYNKLLDEIKGLHKTIENIEEITEKYYTALSIGEVDITNYSAIESSLTGTIGTFKKRYIKVPKDKSTYLWASIIDVIKLDYKSEYFKITSRTINNLLGNNEICFENGNYFIFPDSNKGVVNTHNTLYNYDKFVEYINNQDKIEILK